MEKPPIFFNSADAPPVPGNENIQSSLEGKETLSPEAEAFYMGVYERARDAITTYASEHADEYGNLVDAAARFVKENFKNNGDVREYALAHVCGGSTPDPATLRYLDTEHNDFYNLIKTYTGLDVYAEDEDEEENE